MLIELFLLEGAELGASSAAFLNGIAAAALPRQSFMRASWFSPAAGGLCGVGARRGNGDALAAIPLVRRRIGPLVVREVAGPYWPYRSLPISLDVPLFEMEEMLRHPCARRELGRIWRLGPILSDDPAPAKLAEAAERAGWSVLRRQLGTCFELNLAALRAEGPWPRGSRLRKNRWFAKQLAQQGPISYRFATGCDWTSADWNAMAAVEANSWISTEPGARTQFLDVQQRVLWERLATDRALAKMIHCAILKVGGIPAAFTFGIEAGAVRYQIANLYDRRFHAHSPGRLLLYEDFARAADRGIAKISWGSGDAGYKTQMGAQAGPAILDLLFVRPPLLAKLLRSHWTRRYRS